MIAARLNQVDRRPKRTAFSGKRQLSMFVFGSAVHSPTVSVGQNLRSSNRRRVAIGEATLVPIWVSEIDGAGRVEFRHLCRGKIPPDGTQVLQ
jgi:hypothetical protein